MIGTVEVGIRATRSRRFARRGVEALQSETAVGIPPRARLPTITRRVRHGAAAVLKKRRARWREQDWRPVRPIAGRVGEAVLPGVALPVRSAWARGAAQIRRIAPRFATEVVGRPAQVGAAAARSDLEALLGDRTAVAVGVAGLPAL